MELKNIVRSHGGQLMQLEMSETPTRSYVLNLQSQQDYMEHMKRNSSEKVDKIVDDVLDNVLSNH